MNKYTIYLGLKDNSGKPINEEIVLTWLVSKFNQFGIEGATITRSLGYWSDQFEPSLVITLISHKDLKSFCTNVAVIYSHDFNQDAVLIEHHNVIHTVLEAVSQI